MAESDNLRRRRKPKGKKTDEEREKDFSIYENFGQRSVNVNKGYNESLTGTGVSETEKDGYDPQKDYSVSYEESISRAFRPAYEKFDADANLRRLATEAKISSTMNPILTLSRLSQEETNESGKNAVNTLFDMYRNTSDPDFGEQDDLSVYQPRMASLSCSNKSPYVSITEHWRKADDVTSKDSSLSRPYVSASGIDSSSRSYLSKPLAKGTTAAPPDRNMLIDYSRTTSGNPLSYPRSAYVRPQDSMYVGSNFVMISQRQPDAWYRKVDKLLADVRNG